MDHQYLAAIRVCERHALQIVGTKSANSCGRLHVVSAGVDKLAEVTKLVVIADKCIAARCAVHRQQTRTTNATSADLWSARTIQRDIPQRSGPGQ